MCNTKKDLWVCEAGGLGFVFETNNTKIIQNMIACVNAMEMNGLEPITLYVQSICSTN
jgi:hypothetical protein